LGQQFGNRQKGWPNVGSSITASKDNIRVLIVEDDYLVSEMIKGSLQDIGYSIVGEAIDGAEAVILTRSLKPDVILMDIEMPHKNGIEATQEIYECCPTPVVVLTAYETPDLVAQATAAGVGAYLIKPPNTRELERAITIALARFEDSINLRDLNLKLKNRNTELDTFAHIVSHNLQHSLDLIFGYSNVLKKQARLPEGLEHYLNMIIRSVHTMSSVIDELQLLAGVRTTDLDIRPINMNRVVARTQQRLAYLIEDSQAKLTIPSVWPTACGHEPWIEEIWVSFISMAIKHGGTPPHLHLGATARSKGNVRFWVRDNGPGLSTKEINQLFFPDFEPGSSAAMGLGLSVVHRIAKKLDGEIGVESENLPDKGCTYFFTLPPHSDQ
jgi:two-component system sensor histidine kinase/response regulator